MVPSWVIAVNAAPGSSQPKNAGTMRRCAVLEIGRNSVRPWTMPRTMARSVSMRRRSLSDRPEVGVKTVQLECAKAAEEAVVGRVEVGAARGQQAAARARFVGEARLLLGVGDVERLDAVDAHRGVALDGVGDVRVGVEVPVGV